jgi:hypothetical protein
VVSVIGGRLLGMILKDTFERSRPDLVRMSSNP